MDEQPLPDGKLWVTVSFRLREEEKAALQIMADKLITTPSRLTRFAVCSLLMRRQDQMADSLRQCIYGRNV